jgi:hypothetical protein
VTSADKIDAAELLEQYASELAGSYANAYNNDIGDVVFDWEDDEADTQETHADFDAAIRLAALLRKEAGE